MNRRNVTLAAGGALGLAWLALILLRSGGLIPNTETLIAAFGLALAIVVLLSYVVDLVDRGLTIDIGQSPLLRYPVLPFAVLVMGLLFGHFVW